jgi:hypothetical protein
MEAATVKLLASTLLNLDGEQTDEWAVLVIEPLNLFHKRALVCTIDLLISRSVTQDTGGMRLMGMASGILA